MTVRDGCPYCAQDEACATHWPASSVRRLTPRECERLQGFPDDWSLIEWQGKPAADSRRYAAMGDAVTVPVAEWIGRRLFAALSSEMREAA